jgi:hypothetical protein
MRRPEVVGPVGDAGEGRVLGEDRRGRVEAELLLVQADQRDTPETSSWEGLQQRAAESAASKATSMPCLR